MKRLAVVGAGPAGTEVARIIAKEGWRVDVYEKQPEAGGLLRYGYPGYRMPAAISRRTAKRLQESGVTYHFNQTLGEHFHLDELLQQYNAVVLAIGAQRGKALSIPGETLDNVYQALDYMHQLRSGGLTPDGDVLVIGSGDTAIDVATASLWSGAVGATVAMKHSPGESPAQSREMTLAKEHGVQFLHGVHARAIARNESLSVQFESARGRRFVSADIVVVAVGQRQDEDILRHVGIEHVGNGITSNDRLYMTGEAHHGPNMLAAALKDGRRIAEMVLARH